MEFRYRESSLVPEEEILNAADELVDYAEELIDIVTAGDMDVPEASILALDDRSAIEDARAVLKRVESKTLRHVFLIGIGGSNLGFKAFYEAMPLFEAEANKKRPAFHFLDTTAEAGLHAAAKWIESLGSPEDVLVIAISKSGTTTETAYNLEAIFSVLERKFGDAAARRLVFITDEGSPMHVAAEEREISRLFIPDRVGGRFSVFSAAGLFPLLAAGFDIDRLVNAARAMRESSLTSAPVDNPALVSAAVLRSHLLAGRTIHNTFVFGPELEGAGTWYRQLMGESLGKREDVYGQAVRAGMTPIVSVGSADLHSVGQLYFDGPDDKVTTFLSAESKGGLKLRKERFGLVPNLGGKSAQDIMDSILNGVLEAYY